MTYNKSELEEFSKKYFGPDHERLSPQEKLIKIIESRSWDPIEYEVAVESARKMDSNQANSVLYHFLVADEMLPEAMKAIDEVEKEWRLEDKIRRS
ncbi:MAG TPA: hypothetical protein VJA18_01485 [Candidatus Nanoarchaeia archaeon]|nr:hypothetical protein [Candidatus Nanoarchaeia archaeon]